MQTTRHLHPQALRQIRHSIPSLSSPARINPSQTRPYFSHETPLPAPYPPLETTILQHAIRHVPKHGFTPTSLRLGAEAAGCLSATANLFPRREFDLVLYHLVSQRLALSSRVPSDFDAGYPEWRALSTGARIKKLVLARLDANVEAGSVAHWTHALGQMSLAGNIGASVRELGLLSDEMWFLAGDNSVDSSWYTKRASLAAVYAATETFQTRDQSSGFVDTEGFLDRRLQEVRTLGGAWRNVGQWAGFQGIAAVNLVRSLGVRI